MSFIYSVKGELYNLLLLVDPGEVVLLPALDLLRLEPEGDLLLSVLDRVGTVADVATDVLKKHRG